VRTHRLRRALALVPTAAAFTALLLPAGASARTPACTIYWSGAVSHAWSTPANWSLSDDGPGAGRTPEASDVVCISDAPARRRAALGSDTTATIAGIEWPASGSLTPALTVKGSLAVGTAPAAMPSVIAVLSDSGTLTSAAGEQLGAGTLRLTGDLDGPGSLTVSGAASLSGARLGGAGAGADLILEGAASDDAAVSFGNGSTLENAGTLTLTDGATFADADFDGNQLINDATGTVQYLGADSGGSGRLDVPSTNAGTIDSVEGTLTLSGGNGAAGPDTGTFSAASVGAEVDLGGTRTEATGAMLSGPGTIALDGDTTFAASQIVNAGTLAISGIVQIPATVSIATNNSLSLDADLGGGGLLISNGPAVISGLALGSLTTSFRAVFNRTTSVTGPIDMTNGSTLFNQGTMTLSAGAAIRPNLPGDTSAGTVVNESSATITSEGSSIAPSVEIDLPLTNDGRIIAAAGGLALDGGLTHSGTLKVDPTANLSTTSLTLSTADTLVVAVDGSGDTGSVSVSGTAQLGGTLRVLDPDGQPPVGAEDTILTAEHRTGGFHREQGAHLEGAHYALAYTPTSVVLSLRAGG
jgi:hypothetical protein